MNSSKENPMHQHKYQPTANATETCACGSMRVVESTATVARRNAATIAAKARVNAVLADIPQWAVKMAVSDSDEGAIESSLSAIGKRAAEYAADGRDQYPNR